MKKYKGQPFVCMFEGVGMTPKKFLHKLSSLQMETIKHYCCLADQGSGMEISKCVFEDIYEEKRKHIVSQIEVYTLNCAVYEILKDMGIKAKLMIGHSMGYYAALFASGAVSFDTGLKILMEGYRFARIGLDESSFATAALVGLTAEDVEAIINRLGYGDMAKVAVENNQFSTLVSGFKECLEKIKEYSLGQGAIRAVDIDSAEPYHTHFIAPVTPEIFKRCGDMDIGDAKIPIISCVDQSILYRSHDLIEEVYRNIRRNISWKKAIEKAARQGSEKFIEVGLDNGLVKISRFINSDYEFLSFDKLDLTY